MADYRPGAEGIKTDGSRTRVVSKSEQIAERQAKAKELREEGKTQQQIAEELGVSAKTVQRDSDRNTVITEKVSSTRKVIGYRITQYTKPETAAKIPRQNIGLIPILPVDGYP